MKISHLLRHATDVLITAPYLKALINQASNPEKFMPSTSDVLNGILRGLIKGLRDPFPVSDLWGYLEFKGVDSDEIALLQQVKVLKPKAPRKTTFEPHLALSQIEKASGKSVIDSVKWDRHSPKVLKQALDTWAFAFEKINRFPPAHKILARTVKKIVLGDSMGTETARYQTGDKLFISFNNPTSTKKQALSVLLHELGHALEEDYNLQDLVVLYGEPPYVTEYASLNTSEDFAETFRALLEEPRLLKTNAPAKYADMKARVS